MSEEIFYRPKTRIVDFINERSSFKFTSNAISWVLARLPRDTSWVIVFSEIDDELDTRIYKVVFR